MQYAIIRSDGSYITHSWPVEERAEEASGGVRIDGYLIEDATLEGIRVYEPVSSPSILARCRRALAGLLGGDH